MPARAFVDSDMRFFLVQDEWERLNAREGIC